MRGPLDLECRFTWIKRFYTQGLHNSFFTFSLRTYWFESFSCFWSNLLSLAGFFLLSFVSFSFMMFFCLWHSKFQIFLKQVHSKSIPRTWNVVRVVFTQAFQVPFFFFRKGIPSSEPQNPKNGCFGIPRIRIPWCLDRNFGKLSRIPSFSPQV